MHVNLTMSQHNPPRYSATLSLQFNADPRDLRSFPTRRSSDLRIRLRLMNESIARHFRLKLLGNLDNNRSEEHTSELQSRRDLVCRLLLEKKNTIDGWAGRRATLLSF